MTPGEARSVLAFLATLDPKQRRRDKREQGTHEQKWLNAIIDLPVQMVIVAISTYYARAGADTMSVADLRVLIGRSSVAADGTPQRGHESPHGPAAEAAALDGVDADNVNGYLRALRGARGVWQPMGLPNPSTAALGAGNTASGGAAGPVVDLLLVWLREWRSDPGRGQRHPPMNFSGHLANEIRQLTAREVDYPTCLRLVRAAAHAARCMCGARHPITHPDSPAGKTATRTAAAGPVPDRDPIPLNHADTPAPAAPASTGAAPQPPEGRP